MFLFSSESSKFGKSHGTVATCILWWLYKSKQNKTHTHDSIIWERKQIRISWARFSPSFNKLGLSIFSGLFDKHDRSSKQILASIRQWVTRSNVLGQGPELWKSTGIQEEMWVLYTCHQQETEIRNISQSII